MAPGVCIRLYSEKDYQLRDEYTAPEIQRTNLASVILTTKAFRLGDIDRFPFLDPPRTDAVRDGFKTLFELGALDEKRELTEIGRQLSRLPVDPRIGRMILAANEESCLSEVLIIAAALEIQDPRERPLDRQEEADAQHARFADRGSDFMGYLKLWDFYHKLKKELSRNQLRKACRQNFLSYNRMRDGPTSTASFWKLVEQAGSSQRSEATGTIRSIGRFTGLLSNLAYRKDAHGIPWPAAARPICGRSGVFATKPRWIMAAEVVETTRYVFTCARVNPRWIEPAAKHLVKRYYNQIEWSRSNGSAMALERSFFSGLR